MVALASRPGGEWITLDRDSPGSRGCAGSVRRGWRGAERGGNGSVLNPERGKQGAGDICYGSTAGARSPCEGQVI